MRILTPLLTILSLLILLTTSCTSSRLNQEDVMPPEQGKRQANVKRTNDLVLTLTTEKESYRIGEPIYITATLKNRSNQNLQVFRYLRPGEGALEISIQNTESKAFKFIPLEEADHDKSARTTLGSNQEISDAFPVFFGGHGWSFSKSGTYSLSATYRTKSSSSTYIYTVSTPLSIKIVGQSNEAISAMMSGSKASYQSGLFMTWQAGDHLTKGQAVLEDVLKTKTPLTNYINLAFGKSYSEPFTDYRIPATRPADYELAEKYLSRVRVKELPTYLKIQYHLAYIRCNYNQKVRNKKITLEHFAQIETIAKNKPAYNGLMDRVKKMRSRVE